MGNPSRRANLLYPVLSSSIFFWSFLGTSFLICSLFLSAYEWHPLPIIRLVLGSSLIASLGIAGLLSLVASRYAFPRRLENLISEKFSTAGLIEMFSDLCAKMNIQGADLRVAALGNAFSLDSNGRGIVALAQDLVASMSTEEVEAIIAHELSHLKNKDSREKGLARLAKVAFAFDPVLHLAEAAVHRERELFADQSSVRYTQKPLALASALLKAHSTFRGDMPGPGAGLFVGRRARGLLCKYPDLDRRVQLLIDLARTMKIQPIPA